MGWLQKIFGMEKEPEQVELSLKELPKWIDSQYEEKKGNAQEKLNESNQELSEIRHKFADALDSLEKATLRKDTKLPEKAIQMMHGNRKLYLQKFNVFLKHLEEKDFDELDKVRSEVNIILAELQAVTKATTKAYFVMVEFFRDQCQDAASALKKLTDNLEKKKSIIRGELSAIIKIKKAMASYNEAEISGRHHDKILADTKKELASLEKLQQDFFGQIERLKASEEMQHYDEVKDKKVKAQEQLMNIEREFYNIFGVIEKALKKYEYCCMETELVKSYLKSPFDALSRDQSLEIIDSFQGMKKMLENDKLGITGKKKEKTLQTLDKMNKDFMLDIRNRHSMIRDKITSLDKELVSFGIDSRLRELNEKYDNISLQVKNKRDESERLANKSLKDPASYLRRIEKYAKEFGFELKIDA